MTDGIKAKMPKDIVLLACELGAGIIIGVFGTLLGADADFMEGFFMGIGSVAVLTAIVIVIKRARGKRRFGEQDERERRIKERAALWTLAISILGLSIFSVVAFAIPSVMAIGAGRMAAAAGTLMAFAYLISILVASRRM